MTSSARTLLLVSSLTVCAASAFSQDKPAPKPADPPANEHRTPFDPAISDCSRQPSRSAESDCIQHNYHTYIIPLHNAATQADANEILVAVRNMFDPALHVFLNSSTNVISLGTYPENYARIEAFIRKLDIPHKTYRITYTVAESDAGRRIGVQHFSFVASAGQRFSIKQGSKVPIATGSYSTPGSTSQEQFTYLDIGMNFDTTPTPVGDGLQLKSKVEQSSLAEGQSKLGDRDPIIRQSVLEGVYALTFGKPLTIGSLDIPGSTRHTDIEVQADPL